MHGWVHGCCQYIPWTMSLKAISVLSCIAVVFAQEACRTPNGDGGTCILLDDCHPLKNINKLEVKTPEDLLFLRQSDCGLFMNMKPKVCCPPKGQWDDYTTLRPSTAGSGSIETKTTEKPAPSEIPAPPEQPGSSHFPSYEHIFGKPKPPSSFTPDYSNKCRPTIKPPIAESFCCGIEKSNEFKIIGGKIADIDQYPWLALLEYNGTNGRTACGGSLISARYVLTAAHCIGPTIWGWPVKVRLAEYNTSTYPTDIVETIDGGIQEITVVEIGIQNQFRHPGYVQYKRPITDDIGLIKLNRNAPYNDYIRPICLPLRELSDLPNQDFELLTAGWGHTGVKISDVKLHIKLPYVPLRQCQQAFRRGHTPTQIFDTHICAGGEKDKDSCGGDSGGPLMYLAGDTFILVGIVSFGDVVCGTEGKPGVYTNVYKYLDWIVKNMV